MKITTHTIIMKITCYCPRFSPSVQLLVLVHQHITKVLILYMDSLPHCHLLEQTVPFLWPLSIINKLPLFFSRMVYVTARRLKIFSLSLYNGLVGVSE